MSKASESTRQDNPSRIIREGDIAVFFAQGKKYISKISGSRVKAGPLTFPTEGLIGRSYGRLRLAGMDITIVPALPSDRMEGIRRGPQVILPDDAALIIFHSGIAAGSRVIEAGSGSGSLTIALASAVGKEGEVISIDMSRENIEIARKNIEWAGFSDRVRFYQWDVRKPLPQELVEVIRGLKESDAVKAVEETVDAIILDMPDPWEAAGSLCRFLKKGGVLFSYLPTINQVEKLRGFLKGPSLPENLMFVDPHTFEILRRDMVVRPGAVRPDYSMLGHTGYLTFARRA